MRIPCFILLALTTLSLSSQAAAPTSAAVDKILDAWIQGSGGRGALEKIQSRITKATIEISALGATGSYEERSKAPGKRVTRTEITGLGTLREGFDGQVAWSEMPGVGLSEKAGTELARAQRDAVFCRELHLKDLYERLEANGEAKVGDLPALVLEATPKEGGMDRYYFDAKSGLLLRLESTVASANGPVVVELLFEDHRKVDGLMLPHRVRLIRPTEIAFTLRVTDLTHNANLPDSEFTKPAK